MLAFDKDPAIIQSARHLALCAAFHLSKEPDSRERARDDEIARILAFDPNFLPEAFELSERLIGERDFTAGIKTAVIYNVGSLSEFFAVHRAKMLSACKLCGAMAFQDGNKTVWADDERASFVLDGPAIEAANAEARGE